MSSRRTAVSPSSARIIFVLSLIFASIQLSFSEPKNSGITISNFGKINDNYYRGGQPDQSDVAALKRLGIKTVIDLQKGGKKEEKSWVEAQGMKFIKIPLSNSKSATPQETEYFLKVVNDPANWPVYVHCAGGKHRTGALTAIYRITNDSWTADQAFDEMQKFGWYSFPNHGSLKKHVYSYYQNHLYNLEKRERMVSTPQPSQAGQPVSTTPPEPGL